MTEFLAVAFITILAVISPGADFAIVTKNSYLYGRAIGIFTTIGISLGVLVHVAYTLIAVTALLSYVPQFLNAIKYIGATYLIYIGYQTFVQKPILDTKTTKPIQKSQSLKYGFFTNALNPKTTLFVISTYTQIISMQTPIYILIGYGLFMSLAHLLWFALVALIFSHPALRNAMLSHQRPINRIIGAMLMLLGVFLLLSNLSLN